MPWATSLLSRSVSRLRAMPRSRCRASKRRTPRNASRRMSIVHRSPMSSSVPAIEQSTASIPRTLVGGFTFATHSAPDPVVGGCGAIGPLSARKPGHDGRVRRYFVISGALSLGYGSIYTLLADLRDRYGFSEAQLGVIAGAGFFAGFLAQALLARQADRGRTALMVRGGVILATVAMAGCAVAKAYWTFVLARALLGLGS